MSTHSVESTPVYRLNSRHAQRENTRRQLLDAGLRLVAERGFAGATTAAVAQECGKAHGTVFVHFRSREVLVEELVGRIGEAMSLRLAATDSETPDVATVLDAHLEALAAHEVLYARLLG